MAIKATSLPTIDGMISETPLVSVIIVTCDRPEVLRSCLEHVIAQDYPYFEIIVVDNSHFQEKTFSVVHGFPTVHYIRSNPRRVNPGYMRNQGIRQSRGELLAFIDDDTLVLPGWMAALVEGLCDLQVAAVTGRVDEDLTPVVHTKDIGRLLPDDTLVMNFNNSISESVPVSIIYGCNQAIKRNVLQAHGGFDPWYGMAYEDTEIGLRLSKAGYRLCFLPKMQVKHLKAPRPSYVIQRSVNSDLRSRFVSCRSLAYLCVSQYGICREFLRTSFINLPRSWVGEFLRRPSLKGIVNVVIGLSGLIFGYVMAALRKIHFHRPPCYN